MSYVVGVIAPSNVPAFVNPLAGNADGRGLWMANQLCDLVQVRSFPGEVVVRLYLDVD